MLDSDGEPPLILVFDSLAGRSNHVIRYIKEYLQAELKEKLDLRVGDIPGAYFKGPLQDNHCDCGVYILEYVERFFRDLCTSQGELIEPPVEELRLDYRQWFTPSQIEAKRAHILELLTFNREQYVRISKVLEQTSNIVVGESVDD